MTTIPKLRKLMMMLALLGGFVAIDGSAPARAQIIVSPGWVAPAPGWRHHRSFRRHDCWTESRRVRVWTSNGPRHRWRRVRVCR